MPAMAFLKNVITRCVSENASVTRDLLFLRRQSVAARYSGFHLAPEGLNHAYFAVIFRILGFVTAGR